MLCHRALAIGVLALAPLAALGRQIPAPQPRTSTITGAVVDVRSDAIPAAAVALNGPAPADHAVTTANEQGLFSFKGLKPDIPYSVTVTADGFAPWTSTAIVLTAGQQFDLGAIRLNIAVVQTTVTALTEQQIATKEVHVEEQQRVIGVFPNFYVAYGQNPAPLTTKLKYQLAFRTLIDPVNFGVTALFAGFDQAADTPDYREGAIGYAQRFGAGYADGATDTLIGGAILPSLFHQDPRYFYQGTGTIISRARHAAAFAVLCKGDDGRWQFCYSAVGGDLASGALSNIYYPPSNRSAGLVFYNGLLSAAGRVAEDLAQEFVFQKFTTRKHK